jgi:hypothetical protein
MVHLRHYTNTGFSNNFRNTLSAQALTNELTQLPFLLNRPGLASKLEIPQINQPIFDMLSYLTRYAFKTCHPRKYVASG